MPWFLVVFVALILANSAGFVPATGLAFLVPASNWCLLMAVAALGVRTTLESLVRVGPAPVIAMVLQTVLLAVVIAAGLGAIEAGLRPG